LYRSHQAAPSSPSPLPDITPVQTPIRTLVHTPIRTPVHALVCTSVKAPLSSGTLFKYALLKRR